MHTRIGPSGGPATKRSKELDDPDQQPGYDRRMKTLSDRMIEILAWRSRQPASLRWALTAALFGVALLVRIVLGPLHGANPALSFYPGIILAATFLGWREATALLIMATCVGTWLFLPPTLYLLPVTWMIVGGLNILIIAVLKNVAQQLLVANDQQRVLFAELQHRMANTLQSTVGSIELAKRHIDAAPSCAAAELDEASRRVWAAADVHRRLNDPALVRTELKTILHDAVTGVIDPERIKLEIDIDQPDLTLDQMSTITMIIIECAQNAQKRVFQTGLGSALAVSLKTPQSDRGLLVIRDDGPGIAATQSTGGETTLGQKLLQRMAASLGATVSVTPGSGTEIVIAFPLETTGHFAALSP